MKKIHYLVNCAVCVLASGTMASAMSFRPEVKPLGSLNQAQKGASITETIVSSVPVAAMKQSSANPGYVEKGVNSRSGLIQSYGWLTSAVGPQKAPAEVTVNLTAAAVEGYEVNLAAVGIIDETIGGPVVDIQPDEETGILPATVEASVNTSHTFSVIACGELVGADDSKAVAFYAPLEVTDGVININVDFNESTRQLAFQAYMGNGEEYPEYQPWEYGCGYNISYSSQLAYANCYVNFRVNNPMTFFVYCNEFPGSSYYSISYSANLFDEQVYCNLSGGGSLNEFDDPEYMVECIPAQFYDNMSFSMSLSPLDRAIGKETLISGSKADLAQTMDEGKFGLQTNTLAMCFNDLTRQPVDSYQFYTWIPYSTIAANVQTSIIFNGFGAYDENCAKYCGSRTRVYGVDYILPWEQTWNVERETYSPYSSISRFNIRPTTQDIRNFEYPLYAISSLSFTPEEATGKLKSASYSANYYGMFNEKMNYTGVSVLKEFAIDGEVKELQDILEVELGETHSFDFTFYNPDGYVQNQFETEGLNILHATTADLSDMVPPKMIGMQMYDADDKIKTTFETGEDCHLFVAMYDRTTDNAAVLDFEAKLYVAAQDADEWVEIANPEVVEYDARLGKTFEFAIPTDGTLAANKWMKLKVVGEDSYGNTNTMLLDYCLYIDDVNAVESLKGDGAESAPVYFNLQGMRIENPAKGEIVIEKAGGKVRKVMR